MKQFVILFRQGPHPLSDADKARRQAAISLWAREQNAVILRQGYGRQAGLPVLTSHL